MLDIGSGGWIEREEKHSRARARTHTHTHTHTERERERELWVYYVQPKKGHREVVKR